MKGKRTKRHESMNADELREATAHYDVEMVADQFRRPGPAQKKLWAKARRKPGRPRRGMGAKVISVTVEKALLLRSDRLAKSMGVTRAGLIERGLKAVLAAEGKD